MKTKKFKIVLINPPRYQPVDPYDYPEYPCISLAYLAACVKKDITCIDAKYERINFEELEKRIKNFDRIDIAGVTSMTHNIVDAHATIEIVKRYHPGAKGIIGGCHVTACPEQTLSSFKSFDIGVISEGEETFPELITAIKNNMDIHSIKGICYRKDTDIILTQPRTFIEDINTIPEPAWHLFSNIDKTLPVLTTRGCPYKCNFCMRVLGDKVRFRSPGQVIKELKNLVENFGVKRIYFQDETFTINKKRLKKILHMMIDEKLNDKIEWWIQTRVDSVDMEILTLMKKAGCVEIGFGIESGNELVLKNSGKNITKQQATHAVKAAKQVGLKVFTYFIFGHPNETIFQIKDTIRFAAQLNAYSAIFGMMVPYPGTKIREIAVNGKGGYVSISEDWNDYGKNIGHPLELKSIPRKKMMRLQLMAYFHFYFANFRLIDFIKLFFSNTKTIFTILSRWKKS
ncbi:Fe-S oxidoreductase [Candidatus Magnetomorum sp. HK-1]|nr:Fe-S oxidoreductase [Candidatus Magnetomorum sp. HK-1]